MQASKRPLSVYIHIPFCLKACPYCNFNFRLLRQYDEAFVSAYCDALILEWNAWQESYGPFGSVESIYFGGGTPSLLKPARIESLLKELKADVSEGVEITLEANPEGLDRSILEEFRLAGVNRLSLGIQSFQDEILNRLGRNHSPQEARMVIQRAKEAGFNNLSSDLIGAVPGQALRHLEEDMDILIEEEMTHISYYNLTIEEKTAFHRQFVAGNLVLPGEEEQAQMYRLVKNKLGHNGFTHYEISNFARAGFESCHNSGYWTFREYIGLGAGAHSFLRIPDDPEGIQSRRMSNVRDPRFYEARIRDKGLASEFQESLTGPQAMGEFVFTGLRSLSGVSCAQFREVFKNDLDLVYQKPIEELLGLQLVEWNSDRGESRSRLRLTAKGLLLADSVFEFFVA